MAADCSIHSLNHQITGKSEVDSLTIVHKYCIQSPGLITCVKCLKQKRSQIYSLCHSVWLKENALLLCWTGLQLLINILCKI